MDVADRVSTWVAHSQNRTLRDQIQSAGMSDQMLSLYEGQMVSAVILDGRPDINLEQLEPFMLQKANQPFSGKSVEQTAKALRTAGHFNQVRCAYGEANFASEIAQSSPKAGPATNRQPKPYSCPVPPPTSLLHSKQPVGVEESAM